MIVVSTCMVPYYFVIMQANSLGNTCFLTYEDNNDSKAYTIKLKPNINIQVMREYTKMNLSHQALVAK